MSSREREPPQTWADRGKLLCGKLVATEACKYV